MKSGGRKSEDGNRELFRFDGDFFPRQDYLSLYVPERILPIGRYLLDLQVSLSQWMTDWLIRPVVFNLSEFFPTNEWINRTVRLCKISSFDLNNFYAHSYHKETQLWIQMPVAFWRSIHAQLLITHYTRWSWTERSSSRTPVAYWRSILNHFSWISMEDLTEKFRPRNKLAWRLPFIRKRNQVRNRSTDRPRHATTFDRVNKIDDQNYTWGALLWGYGRPYKQKTKDLESKIFF